MLIWPHSTLQEFQSAKIATLNHSIIILCPLEHKELFKAYRPITEVKQRFSRSCSDGGQGT